MDPWLLFAFWWACFGSGPVRGQLGSSCCGAGLSLSPCAGLCSLVGFLFGWPQAYLLCFELVFFLLAAGLLGFGLGWLGLVPRQAFAFSPFAGLCSPAGSLCRL